MEASAWFTSEAARQRQGSDYARSQGLWLDLENLYYIWLLRSPYSEDSVSVWGIRDDGTIDGIYIAQTNMGVLPALVIEL